MKTERPTFGSRRNDPSVWDFSRSNPVWRRSMLRAILWVVVALCVLIAAMNVLLLVISLRDRDSIVYALAAAIVAALVAAVLAWWLRTTRLGRR